jgi:hypothetical protein
MANRASIREGREDCLPPVLTSTKLIFLAAVHGDPAGYERAWRFFEYAQPEIITVEISPFSVRYRERAARDWQRRLAEVPENPSPRGRRQPGRRPAGGPNGFAL